MNTNLQLEIQTRLQQAQVDAKQAQWQETIAACQQVIEYCRRQLSTFSTETTTPETYISNGERALAQGDIKQAIAQYNLALKLNPNLPQAHKKLADALSQNGQWEKAATYYRQAIKLKKSFATSTLTPTPPRQEKSEPVKPLGNNGIVKTDANNAVNSDRQINPQVANRPSSKPTIEAKIEHYQQEIQNNPNSAELLANLGNLYAQKQQWQQASTTYERALEINPNLATVCRNLAKVAENNGQLELAADYWYRALNLEPSWATAESYVKLGNTLYQQQKSEPAISCYRQAIALQPDLTEAYLRLEKIFNDLKQLERGDRIAQELIAQHPQSAAVYLYQGRILASQGKLPEAKAAYQQATKLNPQLWQAFYYWAEIAKDRGEWEEAATIYRQALATNQDVFLLHHNLGYATFRLQNWEESIQALHKAIELNSNHLWSYVYLGIIDTTCERWKEAITNLLKAIALKTDLVGIYKQLGIALRKYFLSIKDLETTTVKVEQLLPFEDRDRTADFYCQIAANLNKEKQYDGAIVFYNLASKLQPDDAKIDRQLQEAKEQQQQLQLDIINCQQQIIASPKADWKYVELGNIFADLGDFEAAIKLHRQGSILRGWDLAGERNYQFQYDWFTHNISVWQTQLKSLVRTPIKMLEIGSYEGMATCWLLDYILTHPSATITCIDIYFQDNFERNIAQTQAKEKVTKLCGNSHQILPTLSPNTYDLLYIDGSHLATDVKQDAVLSWDLLKVGGVVIFDDYLLEIPDLPEQNPKIGIDEFLATIDNCYETTYQNYQLIIKKTA